MTKYRVLVVYSEETEQYKASAPELDGCEIEAESRAEAVTSLEQEIADRLQNMEEQGIEPPTPIDEQDLDGNLTVKVSRSLHRDLVFLAKQERVELEDYVAELLARGVFRGRSGGRGREGRGEGARRGRPREGQGQRYHDIMENRADFIEYVRRLDSGGGGGSGGRGGGGRGGRRGGRRGKRRDGQD